MVINESFSYFIANDNYTLRDQLQQQPYNVDIEVTGNGTREVLAPPASPPGHLQGIVDAFAIAGLIVGPLGLIGNILTIIVLTNKTMRSSTNSYLTSLAIWDSIVILTSLFLIYLVNFVPILICTVQVAYPTALTAQTATIWITVSFTVERFIAVCHPLRAASMCTIRRARIVIFGVSLSSVLYNLPRWFEYKLTPKWQPERTNFGNNPIFTNTYYMIYLPIMCIIPLCVLSVVNIFLIRAVRESSHQRADMNVRQSRENNVTIMLVSVVVVFIICQVPALVYNVAYAIDRNITLSYSFQVLSNFRNFLVVVNSTINFLLYCAFGQKFRRTFVRMVCWCVVPETLRRQHSFSHLSNTAQGNATQAVLPQHLQHQRNSGNNQYTRIPNHARSPQHCDTTVMNHRNSSGTTTRSSTLSKDSSLLSPTITNTNCISLKITDNHQNHNNDDEDDFIIDSSKPIIEEFELSDLHQPSPDEPDGDNDSQETVLRQLIPTSESFCVYKVDLSKFKNGTIV
ncbi:FMRFamide receptor-like [Tubulanus polymorphus]|uniref:FMRFamide receptor-like n=1 Tax=Tubulanus polymorphus TaxID=672921 RepID=UPI003DA39863